jgi:hypothetical protein
VIRKADERREMGDRHGVLLRKLRVLLSVGQLVIPF